MSLVTRCPACSTAFKVVRDQLRISEGWVRCGRCSQVFDATLDLQDSEGGEPNAPVAPSPDASPEATAPIASDPAPAARVEYAGTAPSLDEDDFVEPDELPAAAAPATNWPARELLDLGPVASPAAASAESARSEVSRVASSSASTERAVPAPAAGWSPFPAELPAIMADEPWPLGAESPLQRNDTASGEDMPPSPVDEAVNAQLQKALRRARIQALRESRARARAEAGAQKQAALGAAPSVDADAPVT